jgi:hypothetical protein
VPSSVPRHAVARMPLPQLAFPPSYRPNLPAISPMSMQAIGLSLSNMATSSWASAAYPAANRALAFPFEIADPFLVRKVWWVNGTTATTNSADVGVYTEAGALLVSGGGTAIAGASTLQEADVTDTLLVPGRYWCAYAQNGTTATPLAVNSAAANLRAMGCAQMASAYPLPATLVPAANASAYLPFFGIANRMQVA